MTPKSVLAVLLLAFVAVAWAMPPAYFAAVEAAADADAEEGDSSFLDVENGVTDAEADAEADADEAEDEAEDEGEDEADAEADAEAEAEADADAEADAVAEFEAAIGESAGGKWHVYSNVVTEQAHEGICAAALASLTPAKRAYFDLPKLKTGAIWNDMPSGTEADEAAMIADGHMDVDTWTRLFFVTGGIDDLVFNVHYGCLQHMHSMAPIKRVEAKNAPSTRVVFTNAQVKQMIIGQINAWWNRAVALKADKPKASWYLGHILHAIQDSYPRGHVVRTASSTSPGVCGDVVLFQGYDAQHKNAADAHKKGDYSPAHSKHEADPTLTARYNCAKKFSADVLSVFADCAAGKANECTTKRLGQILGLVYRMAPGADRRIAGGTDEEFGKPGIAADATNYTRERAHGRTLFNPKSTHFWGAGTSQLCGGTRPIQSKVKTMLKTYREKDFNGYQHFQG